MKERVKIIAILFILTLLFCIFALITKAYAVSYENINLNSIKEIKDNQALLDTVKTVNISYESDLSLVSELSKCYNLENLTIKKATIDDLKFINDIKTSNEFDLELRMGYYNMEGISNSYIKRLVIESSFVTNFSKGMDFENVEKIVIECISGYEDINYSNFSKLNSLSFDCISISDYKTFFEQLKLLNNLKHLRLTDCDITEEDTKYLKELTNIISLSLEKCHITDISFLKEMSQLTWLMPPINVEDLSVIKELPNLETIYWSGYEQLALTEDLVKYLDDNNINHNKYDETLKRTLLSMVNEMNINENMTIKEKVETVIDYTTNFVVTHDTPYDETYSGNSLLYIVHFKAGVCNHYSYLEHALLRLIGVDAYFIDGMAQIYMSETTGEYYIDNSEYELAGHAWLMVQDENGLWYGWDPVNIDFGSYPPWGSVMGKLYNFWKNPYENDAYTFDDYNDGKYDSFNYYFATRNIVTNKIGYNDYLQEKDVIFNSNDGNDIKLKQRVAYNFGNKLNKNTFTRDGYTFVSWNTKADGTGTTYQDEELINISEDITLYAQWELITYTIKFYAGSGYGTMEDVTGIIGEYILPECEFTSPSPGLEFEGWFIPDDRVLMKTGSKIIVNRNIELFAQWKQKEIYTVTFNTCGGNLIDNQTILKGKKATMPGVPIREEYTFVGWYEDSTYKFKFDFNNLITADTTIYAKWVRNENIIKTVNLNVEKPTVGDEVTIEKYDEDYWNWDSQKPQMNITVPEGAHYHLEDNGGEYNYMWWIAGLEDEWTPFVGTFEYDTDYYAKIFVSTESEYYFDNDIKVTVNGKEVDTIFYFYDHYIELGVKLTTPKKTETITYKILDGSNQTYTVGQENDLTVKTNGETSKFEGLKVDGKILDSTKYKVVSGSTVATLEKEYLDALAMGKHTLTFVYTDGEVSTDFTIAKVEINDNSETEIDDNINTNINTETTQETKVTTSSSPETGDNIKLWITLMLVSILGIFGTYKYIKKRD